MSGLLLRRAVVEAVQQIGGFARVVLRSDLGTFPAGTKVQILLPSDDVRTYTPVLAPEGLLLLGWKHAGGPGSRWLSSARVGEVLPFVGPQHSLELPAGRVVLVGDETSVAVAASLSSARPGQVHAIIQSNAASDVHEGAASVGLREALVVPAGNHADVARAVSAHLAKWPDALVALTGGSPLIVATRDALRRDGIRHIKTKTYWVPGRTGLD